MQQRHTYTTSSSILGQKVFDQMQGMRFRIVSTPIPKRVWIRIWQLLIILTAVCAFVPLRPEMPQAGLDHSWVLGMNQAVAQGLVFGRDIIFTFGPYASIYTKSFHPATDHLMVVGALFLGLIYGTGLVLVARGREAIPLTGLCLALALAAGLQQSQDSLLLAYPLIVSLYCFGLPREASPSQGAWNLLAISVSVLFLPFGLLPLNQRIAGRLVLGSHAICSDSIRHDQSMGFGNCRPPFSSTCSDHFLAGIRTAAFRIAGLFSIDDPDCFRVYRSDGLYGLAFGDHPLSHRSSCTGGFGTA
ncbi:hypothetical protein [Ralstonia syzygii]|uniref:hypothetical protein n=1 Tax=Ralstonia syzygii TaxID=28097 RepID=UPI001E561130|nr:hypothetical protein [Ralstonia syzygii]